MAGFIAKHMFGKKLDSFKDKLDGSGDKEQSEEDVKQQQETQEAYQKDIAERHKKHLEFEEDREKMRQRIRDKYGLPKRDYSSDNVEKDRLKTFSSMSETSAAVSEKMESADSGASSFLPKPVSKMLDDSDSKKSKDCVIQ